MAVTELHGTMLALLALLFISQQSAIGLHIFTAQNSVKRRFLALCWLYELALRILVVQ